MHDNRILNRELGPTALVFLFFILQLLIALLTHSLAFTQEESMWHYIGRNWFRHGMTPYAGGVDNKSPLIFTIFGFSDWLFGVNYWFPRVLGPIIQTIGLIHVFKITVQLGGQKAGIFAIVFYGCSLLWRSTGGMYVSFTETYAVTFTIVAFYYALFAKNLNQYLIGGLLAGIGFMFRFSAVFGIAAITVSLLRKNLQAAVLFITGACISVTIVLSAFYLAGIQLNEVVYYTFSDNFGPGSITDRSVAAKMEGFANSFFYTGIILFYPFVLSYFLLTVQRQPALSTWLLLEFAGIIALGVFARNHLRQLLPVLAIVSSMAAVYLTYKYKLSYKLMLIIILIGFLPKTLEPAYGLKNLVWGVNTRLSLSCDQPPAQPSEYDKKQLGLWIRANTHDTDQLYIAGTASTIQVYSERLSPTVYFNSTQTTNAKKKLYSDLISNTPDWILVPAFAEYKKHVHRDTRNFIDSLVTGRYRFVRCIYGYVLNQRIDNGGRH